MKQLVTNAGLHYEHRAWEREILFWLDELKIFKKELTELQDHWTDPQIEAEMGQFQITFYKREKGLQTILDEIKTHEHQLNNDIEELHDAVDRVNYRYHEDVRKKILNDRKEMQELKSKFYGLLTKYL